MDKTLATHLGTWRYNLNSIEKYFQVVPINNKYIITCSNKIQSLVSGKRHITVDAAEAFRRILAKKRGGYYLLKPFIGHIPTNANITADELYTKVLTKIQSPLHDWLLQRN